MYEHLSKTAAHALSSFLEARKALIEETVNNRIAGRRETVIEAADKMATILASTNAADNPFVGHKQLMDRTAEADRRMVASQHEVLELRRAMSAQARELERLHKHRDKRAEGVKDALVDFVLAHREAKLSELRADPLPRPDLYPDFA